MPDKKNCLHCNNNGELEKSRLALEAERKKAEQAAKDKAAQEKEKK